MESDNTGMSTEYNHGPNSPYFLNRTQASRIQAVQNNGAVLPLELGRRGPAGSGRVSGELSRAVTTGRAQNSPVVRRSHPNIAITIVPQARAPLTCQHGVQISFLAVQQKYKIEKVARDRIDT